MYVDILSRSLVVSRGPLAETTKGSSNSAMRAVFIRIEIVDGGEEILNPFEAKGSGMGSRKDGMDEVQSSG